jgi:hypothetical protein
MPINARSPHVVQVNDLTQTGSKIEIDLWYYTGTQPTTPTYTLMSKGIPASNNTDTAYNISPYIKGIPVCTSTQVTITALTNS